MNAADKYRDRSCPQHDLGLQYDCNGCDAEKLARCKCGLLLPCNDCLKPIDHYASQQSRDAE